MNRQKRIMSCVLKIEVMSDAKSKQRYMGIHTHTYREVYGLKKTFQFYNSVAVIRIIVPIRHFPFIFLFVVHIF